MKLYLVRHAEAADKRDDPERHLTRRGRRDAQALAEQLRPLKIRADVWHSPKPRAVETAEAVAPALTGRARAAEHRGLMPADPVKPIAAELERGGTDVMIVGHEPFLGRLAARLLTGDASVPVVSLDKPSALCLGYDGDEGVWRIEWMLSGATGPAGAKVR